MAVIGALLAALVAAAPALLVDRAADAGLPCPANAALEEELRRGLPGVRLEATGGATEGDLRATLAPTDAGWSLALAKPGGEVALSRRLSFAKTDCALLAHTAALVIDRFLEEIRWPGRPPTVQPLPLPPKPAPPPPQKTAEEVEAARKQAAADAAKTAAAEAQAAAERAKRSEFDRRFLSLDTPKAAAGEVAPASGDPAGVAAAGAASTSAASPNGAASATAPPAVLERSFQNPEPLDPRRRPDGHALTISAGPAAWLGLSNDLRAAALVEVAVRLPAPFEVGLTALGAAASSSAVFIEGTSRGDLRVQSGLFGVWASACAAPGAFRLCAGPLAAARVSSGSASGRLFQPASSVVAQVEPGLRASASLEVGSRFSVGLVAIGGAALGTATFNVAGADGGRGLPAIDLSLAIRLGFSLL